LLLGALKIKEIAAAEYSAMALRITLLPPEMLQTVFQFAGEDARTLLNIEKTCRNFQQIVAVDATWKFVPTYIVLRHPTLRRFKRKRVKEHFDFLGCSSNRMRACLCQSIDYIRGAQKSGSSFYESFLDLEEWKELVQDALLFHSDRMGLGELEDDIFLLRKDTMCVLGEIVQTAMISLLSKANSVSCTIAEAMQKYPILTRMDLHHELVSRLLGLNQDFVPPDSEQETELLPEDGTRTAIIHRFSRMAGIVRMANDTYDLVWAAFVNIILMLVGPACRELLETNERGNGKRRLTANESHYSVPPLSKFKICEGCGYPHECLHTVVPKQIQDVAKALGLASKVYGFDNTESLGRDSTLSAQIEMDYEEFEEEEEGVSSDEHSSGDEQSDCDSSTDGSPDEVADADMAEVRNDEDAESENSSPSNGSENDAVEDGMESSADRLGDEESQAARNVRYCVIS
jgi:hypothetical protein